MAAADDERWREGGGLLLLRRPRVKEERE